MCDLYVLLKGLRCEIPGILSPLTVSQTPSSTCRINSLCLGSVSHRGKMEGPVGSLHPSPTELSRRHHSSFNTLPPHTHIQLQFNTVKLEKTHTEHFYSYQNYLLGNIKLDIRLNLSLYPTVIPYIVIFFSLMRNQIVIECENKCLNRWNPPVRCVR